MYHALSREWKNPAAKPYTSNAAPQIVNPIPRMLAGEVVNSYGKNRNQSGVWVAVMVSRIPPMKKMAPAMNIRWADISLCRDSSAFS